MQPCGLQEPWHNNGDGISWSSWLSLELQVLHFIACERCNTTHPGRALDTVYAWFPCSAVQSRRQTTQSSKAKYRGLGDIKLNLRPQKAQGTLREVARSDGPSQTHMPCPNVQSRGLESRESYPATLVPDEDAAKELHLHTIMYGVCM